MRVQDFFKQAGIYVGLTLYGSTVAPLVGVLALLSMKVASVAQKCFSKPKYEGTGTETNILLKNGYGKSKKLAKEAFFKWSLIPVVGAILGYNKAKQLDDSLDPSPRSDLEKVSVERGEGTTIMPGTTIPKEKTE
ncbi:MAG: hypothetical protein BGO10_03820 [Chlamydia sp. 32-24]|nr:MAG: hypothetical protein BGO10_03820 [Chlamydia sp. 32-24]